MTWQEVLERKELQDLPFKIELNEKGKVEKSPATNIHGYLQSEIAGLLRDFLKRKGQVATECSVLTSEGVKVADVAWTSKEFREEFGSVTPFPYAPEICVEIISLSNCATMPEAILPVRCMFRIKKVRFMVKKPKKFSRKLVCTLRLAQGKFGLAISRVKCVFMTLRVRCCIQVAFPNFQKS